MTEDEKEKMREWVNNWKETGKVLEQLELEEKQNSFNILTDLRGVWVATPWDYSSSRWLRFQNDGTAQLCYGYGQTIYAVLNVKFEMTGKITLKLFYLESPPVAFFKGFSPNENQSKEFYAFLTQENNEFIHQITGIESKYRWKLRLNESVFPDSINFPDEVPLEFYGHRI